MDEADKLCDRIAIIDHGKIIVLDTPNNLKNQIGGDVINIETENKEKLDKFIEKCKFCREGKTHDGFLTITVNHAERVLPEIIKISEKHKIKINSISINKPTLEDVFLHFTGKTIREQEADSKDHFRMRNRSRR